MNGGCATRYRERLKFEEESHKTVARIVSLCSRIQWKRGSEAKVKNEIKHCKEKSKGAAEKRDVTPVDHSAVSHSKTKNKTK